MQISPLNAEAGSNNKKLKLVELWSPVIGFFRCYGVIPLRKCDKGPSFERCLGSLCLGLFLLVLFILELSIGTLVLKDSSKVSSRQFADASLSVDCLVHCVFTMAFLIVKSGDLVRVLKIWIDTEKILANFNVSLGKVTFVKCWILLFAFIIFITLENAIFISNMVYLLLP